MTIVDTADLNFLYPENIQENLDYLSACLDSINHPVSLYCEKYSSIPFYDFIKLYYPTHQIYRKQIESLGFAYPDIIESKLLGVIDDYRRQRDDYFCSKVRNHEHTVLITSKEIYFILGKTLGINGKRISSFTDYLYSREKLLTATGKLKDEISPFHGDKYVNHFNELLIDFKPAFEIICLLEAAENDTITYLRDIIFEANHTIIYQNIDKTLERDFRLSSRFKNEKIVDVVYFDQANYDLDALNQFLYNIIDNSGPKSVFQKYALILLGKDWKKEVISCLKGYHINEKLLYYYLSDTPKTKEKEILSTLNSIQTDSRNEEARIKKNK